MLLGGVVLMVVWLPWGKGAGPAVARVSASASADGEVVVDAEGAGPAGGSDPAVASDGAASTSFEK